MAHGKMKTLYGLYKKLGRDIFLETAGYYSSHVKDSVESTLAEMESRWYDPKHTMTEADKMIDDYNNGRMPDVHPGHADTCIRMRGDENGSDNYRIQ